MYSSTIAALDLMLNSPEQVAQTSARFASLPFSVAEAGGPLGKGSIGGWAKDGHQLLRQVFTVKPPTVRGSRSGLEEFFEDVDAVLA